jgi:hypothetical protein
MATSPIDAGDGPPEWPASEHPRDIGFHRRKRVRWLAPGTLVRTGFQVVVAQKFVELLDRRELQAAAEHGFIDMTGPARTSDDGDSTGSWEELWIDYVADTGDGFDATATVTSQLARDTIELDGNVTHAGSLLVLGGDQVYPAAESRAYDDRLIGPLRAMLPWTDAPRRIVALPGNHDWYDGLTSFLRTFCQRPHGRWLGGWKTEQSRSYWAVRLPQGWWLWGIDVQLGSLIDAPQLAYFEDMARRLAPDDRIILCWAKPTWTEASNEARSEAYAVLDYFERKVIGDPGRVRVSLAGDTHHYARFAPEDPTVSQKITAGGGGAYLSATHRLPRALYLPPDAPRADQQCHTLVTTYPDAKRSLGLSPGVLGAIYGNPGFFLIPAMLYAALALPINWLANTLGLPDPGVRQLVPPIVICALLTLAMLGGLFAFAGFSNRPPPGRAAVAAVLHVALHALVLLGAVLLNRGLDWPFADQAFGAATVAFAVGALVGPLVTAGYLLIAQFLGVNLNELFSAMAIEDFKCFLRIHVRPDGDLTIYPIKIERTPRWTFTPVPERPGATRWYTPTHEPVAELIEPPIPIPRA